MGRERYGFGVATPIFAQIKEWPSCPEPCHPILALGEATCAKPWVLQYYFQETFVFAVISIVFSG